jgi:hypothetical protein
LEGFKTFFAFPFYMQISVFPGLVLSKLFHPDYGGVSLACWFFWISDEKVFAPDQSMARPTRALTIESGSIPLTYCVRALCQKRYCYAIPDASAKDC